MNFTYEYQGINIFFVHELSSTDAVDSASIGILSDKRISGLVPAACYHKGDTKFIKYDVTSKVSLKQYYTGIINKSRVLGVFYSITSDILASEEHILEASNSIFHTEYIFLLMFIMLRLHLYRCYLFG